MNALSPNFKEGWAIRRDGSGSVAHYFFRCDPQDRTLARASCGSDWPLVNQLHEVPNARRCIRCERKHRGPEGAAS